MLGNRICGISNGSRADEHVGNSFMLGSRKGKTREPVFRHFKASASSTDFPTKIDGLTRRQTQIMGDDDDRRFFEIAMQRSDQL